MIGEPELEGAWAADVPAGTAGSAERDVPARSLRAAPWRWALGGAVAASAVFAGALVVQERYVVAGPPIRYRHSEQLCTETPLKAVGAALGSLGVGMPSHGEGPALDWSYCFAAGARGEQEFSHEAEVLVELHKKADPETEFGADPMLDPFGSSPSTEAERVSGLGERALFSGGVQAPRLQVLDGGAVFTVTVHWWGRRDGGASDVDGDAVKAAMVEDARALMARLGT
ncbi:hypothetical protein AB0469_29860 [Streptomyces sp. NPDC093801]|uniref:hypothetical protein n=1 Tax=Streptomyces sp. NPDC093801 TaxID=3155203 RepID=UPI00344BA234